MSRHEFKNGSTCKEIVNRHFYYKDIQKSTFSPFHFSNQKNKYYKQITSTHFVSKLYNLFLLNQSDSKQEL